MSALFVASLALAGCSTTIADMPGVAPAARSQEAGAYPPVNDLPPDRDQAVLDPAARAKIEKELIAARDRQASANPTTPPAPSVTAKPNAPARQTAKKPRQSPTAGQNASALASDAQASAAQASAPK